MKTPEYTRRIRTAIGFCASLGFCVFFGAFVVGGQQTQEPPPMSGVVFKNKAPVSDTLLEIKLPRPQEADLPNGLHVMVLEDRRAPQVTVQLSMRGAGGYYDPADHFGLAQFTAANLNEGTTTRSTTEIAEQLDRLSATLNANAGMSSEDATITGTSLKEHVDVLLDLMADVLLNPTFPEQEFARYQTQTRAQLLQQRANPGFLAQERFSAVVAGDHPDGRIAPKPEVLDKTTRDHLVAFHRARYGPEHAVMAMAGDITMADAMKKIQARLGAWKKTGSPVPTVTDPAALKTSGIFLVERPNSVQTSLIVGVQAINRNDPDYFPLSVLNRVVGGGPTGRLFRHLREEKGYTYGAGSTVVAPRFRGVWVASTNVRTEVTEPALNDLLDELRQAREVPIPSKEFSDAKRSMIAAFALTLESPQALLNNAVTRYRFNLPADYWDRYPERVNGVTVADAQAMAKKYLDPSRIQIVAVGSGEGVVQALGKLGTVQVYDSEGRPVTSK